MKSLIRALLICTLLFAGAKAWAGAAATAPDLKQPTLTSAGNVALLYHRLIGQQPDFQAWAMASDAYEKANGFDKDLVMREKVAEATGAYHLINLQDPIIIGLPVKLSSYSRAKQGFFVQNFRPDTFYSYSFLGRDYAVVPLDLLDFQWLAVSDTAALQKLSKKIENDDGQAYMYLSVIPTFADKANPMKVGENTYWLLSGRVQKLQIYDRRRIDLLWEGMGKQEVEQTKKEVLDLYK